jgi:hypothetical protein
VRRLVRGAALSAAGHPKFTASRRQSDGCRFEAIVKFSGADGSAAVQRWSDLLVCEHLALLTPGGRPGRQQSFTGSAGLDVTTTSHVK